MSDELDYRDILDRVAELLKSLRDEADPATLTRVEEMVDWLDVFHREGLGRFVEMVRQWRGEIFLEQAALDPMVGELLSTYGLGVDADTAEASRQVQQALDSVRGYVHSHGGEIEVRSIADGVVTLRMHGTCDGCTAADDTVTRLIEVALREHWVDFRRVDTEEPTAPAHPPPPDSTGSRGHVVEGLQITSKSSESKRL